MRNSSKKKKQVAARPRSCATHLLFVPSDDRLPTVSAPSAPRQFCGVCRTTLENTCDRRFIETKRNEVEGVELEKMEVRGKDHGGL
jgi:hypothetical protein